VDVSLELFVERFLVEPESTSVSEAIYDEQRAYAVTQDGQPVVAVFTAGETHTVTEVRNEAPDADPEPDVKTLTFVEAEAPDVSLAANETFTRVKAEAPDEPWALVGTETFTKVRAEAPDEPWALATETFTKATAEAQDESWALSTMTKTGLEYPRDDDSD
jgi:hypothetical protein